ncbi:carboxymuconolactone decarboxylase family protein [Sphingobium tyrosinilyticum]|uniref:Carboxymuconolactone decarboxylase family protein n=1 Tax=Sphingobium tyrosinilyticum TaxID=2715436 RepID=A0ABV9F711_9SPHN
MADVDRRKAGQASFERVLRFAPPAGATTPLIDAAQDFVFAEVWNRPGLDTRSRRWITLACVAAARAPVAIRAYVNAALDSGEINLEELREFALQFAVFQGFPKAVEFEAILNEVVAARN